MTINSSIRQRLIGAMTILGLLVILTGVAGIYGMRAMYASMREINTNTLPSALAIADSQLAIARARLVLDRVVVKGGQADEAELGRAAAYMTQADKAWADYLALPQESAEKALSDEVGRRRRALSDEGYRPMLQAIGAEDNARARHYAMTVLPALYTELTKAAAALTDFQSQVNQRYYAASQDSYQRQLWIAGAAIAVSLLTSVVACLSLLRAIMGPISSTIRHFDGIATGDLGKPIIVHSQDEMGKLMQGLAGMQQQLAGTIRAVRNGTETIATATTQIAAGNLDLSRRTEQQAASLEETASSLEQLTAAVRQNSESARQSSALAHTVSQAAQQSGELVHGVVGTMSDIRQASARIADIIGVIDGIAFQTNILALNAAVEAARAGEQGRGFAVVAAEVRHLAQRSAEAAKDIKELIGESVGRVDRGADLVASAGDSMTRLVGDIQRVARLMSEIEHAGQEQEVGIGQINQAITELDAVTQQNAALVEEATAAAEALREQAERLAGEVSVFQLDDGAQRAASPPRQLPRLHSPAGQPAMMPATLG
ncbi:HAMP domain-containing protein [Duganella sp. FT50W]|uniref:HAMP domain-containing protein n=1 Tax=Duganella lactea TaxID=2692173 RepID=A0A6L8MIY7_9BURK|nr:methyl-accepting chemotaxis protein [Duganella lactea]MYM82499.1 HAMP domain-containing protein [Duganella lactea]